MNLTDLPIEIQSKILINLPLNEILGFRLLSKGLRHLIDNFLRLDHLLVDSSDHLSFEKEEFNHFLPAFYQHSVRSLDRARLRRPLFRGIRHLSVRCGNRAFSGADVEFLNFYSNLEHLNLSRLPDYLDRPALPEFRTSSSTQIPENHLNTLALRRLKILKIDRIDGGRLVLDLPCLAKLKVKGSVEISFVHPESVKCAYVSAALVDQLIDLNNLELLLVDDLTAEQLPLAFAKILKEFHFKSQRFSDLLLTRLKSQLNGRPGLKAYSCGVDINRLAGSPPERSTTELICRHHIGLADVLIFVETFHYSCLENFFGANLPEGLTGRLLKVKRVDVDERIKHEQQLSRFLADIAYLTELKFIGSRLTQQFYDGLSKRNAFVQELVIVDDWNIVEDLNLSFVFFFHYLETFITNKHLDCDLIESLFKQLHHFRLLKFKRGRAKFDVWFAERGKLLVTDVSRNTVHGFEVYKATSKF